MLPEGELMDKELFHDDEPIQHAKTFQDNDGLLKQMKQIEEEPLSSSIIQQIPIGDQDQYYG